MKVKVCPCCDQPIQGIYCKGCRKIVLNPVEQNITYYLNQRHPEFETDCSFHGNTALGRNSSTNAGAGTGASEVRTSEHRMTVNEMEAKKAEIRARMQARAQEASAEGRKLFRSKTAGERENANRTQTILNGDVIGAKTAGRASNVSGAARRESGKQRTGFAVALTFGAVFLVFLFTVASIVFVNLSHSGVFDISDAVIAPAYEPEWEVPEPMPDLAIPEEIETPLEDWERTDAEVKALGEPCTGYGHFSVGCNDETRAIFEAIVEEAGFRIWEETVYSYNSQMDFDSWYQTTYEFTIDSEDAYIGTIAIETDTATGQIHGFSMYNSDEKCFYELVDIVLKFMQNARISNVDFPQGESFYEEARWKNEDVQREYGYVMLHDLEVSAYVSDEIVQDFFSMSIYAPGYMSAVEE